MTTVILSDQMGEDYSKFVTEALMKMGEHKVKSICICAKIEDGQIFTGTWNVSCDGKLSMANHLMMEAVDDMILANIGRYKAAAEEYMGEEENEDGL